jgi:hypothetical protein
MIGATIRTTPTGEGIRGDRSGTRIIDRRSGGSTAVIERGRD